MRTLLVLLALALASTAHAQPLSLWYDEPAREWTDALPVGNGRLGAMVFGGVARERIQFNEDTVWTGQPHDYSHAGASASLGPLRDLLWAGEASRGRDPGHGRVHERPAAPEGVSGVRRSDPRARRRRRGAGHRVPSRARPRHCRRRHGVSGRRDDDPARGLRELPRPGHRRPGDHLAAPGDAAPRHPRSAPTTPIGSRSTTPAPSRSPAAFPMGPSASKPGCTSPRAVFEPTETGLTVTGPAITFLLAAATSFVSFEDTSADPRVRNDATLRALAGRSLQALRDAHVADHQALFRRVAPRPRRSDGAPAAHRRAPRRLRRRPTIRSSPRCSSSTAATC